MLTVDWKRPNGLIQKVSRSRMIGEYSIGKDVEDNEKA
jgi:hypothetical protein